MNLNPKKFRERLNRTEKPVNTDDFASDMRTEVSENKAVRTVKFPNLEHSDRTQCLNNSEKYSKLLECRDQHIIIQPPLLPEEVKARQKELKLWLAEVARNVFSISFNYFHEQKLRTLDTKSYCSENFIGNIISLSKKNHLTSADFKIINKQLHKQLLPYFLTRYPQADSSQINQNLNKQISLTNSMENNENNLLTKCGISFDYRQDGIYLDKIMEFINYVLEIPNQQITVEKSGQKISMFNHFNNKMAEMFESVQSRVWTETNYYDEFVQSGETMNIEQLKEKVQELNVSIKSKKMFPSLFPNKGGLENILQQNEKFSETNNIIVEKSYEDNVKSYTDYAINQKISKNVPKFCEDSIRHMNLKIPNSAVLRIIVKWCNQLEDLFSNPEYYAERNVPFITTQGDEVQMDSQNIQLLCEYMQEQKEEIEKFIKQLRNDNFLKQSELSHSNLLHQSKQQFPEFEETLFKFTSRSKENVEHYSVVYLNRLIHGLLHVSRKIYKGNLESWAEWEAPPQLITFTISDLLRCKFFSKEKEVIRIYKEIQLQSIINPHEIKVIRVKNRLSRGTKDILINIMLKEQTLCEIQLAIKLDFSSFILHSDKFNHYIYELKRSIFGPISQMCSIWNAIDSRAGYISDFSIHKDKFQHKCSEKTPKKAIFLPFTCCQCLKYYSNSRFMISHMECTSCHQYQICGACRLKTISEDTLKKDLNLQKDIGRMIRTEDELPEYFLSIQLQSMAKKGRKYRKFEIDKKIYFVRRYDDTKAFRIKSIKSNNSKEKSQFFKKYLIFDLFEKDPDLTKIEIQEIQDYLSIQQIKECYEKNDQALRISGKGITPQLIMGIKDTRGQAQITNFSFPGNKICSLKEISQKFKNVKVLNLDGNGLNNLKGIGNMKKLTDVYLQNNKFNEIVQLESLTELKYIQLGNNSSGGATFKCKLSGLTKLKKMTFIDSQLSQFPEEITEIPNLRLLWLQKNKIKAIPPSIKNMKFLNDLSLSGNQIQNIPEQLYECKNLSILYLGSNLIKEVTDGIFKLKSLKKFEITENPLQKFPDSFLQKLPELQEVFMSENQIAQFKINKFSPKLSFA